MSQRLAKPVLVFCYINKKGIQFQKNCKKRIASTATLAQHSEIIKDKYLTCFTIEKYTENTARQKCLTANIANTKVCGKHSN